MIRVTPAGCLLVLLAGCTSAPDKPAPLRDAELNNREGVQAFAEADWPQARRLFSLALNSYRGIDDREGVLRSAINLAETALSQHDYDACKDYLAQAARAIEDKTNPLYQTRLNLLEAKLAIKLGQTKQAEQLLQTILPPADSTMTLNALELAALAERTNLAFAQQQDAAVWVERYAVALKREDQHNPALTARLLRFQAVLAKKDKNAEAFLLQALSLYKKSYHPTGVAGTLVELGQLYRARGDITNARDNLQRAAEIYRRLDDAAQIRHLQRQLNEWSSHEK